MNNSEFQTHAEQIEQLVERVSALSDENARTVALELLQSLMDLHGAALSRVVEVLSSSGEGGRSSLARLGGDPLICGLLVLYGIHPVALEDRVNGAIEKIGPQLRKQSGTVQLLGIANGVVRIKVQSSGQGCGSSSDALKSIAEQAILEAAPEVVEVVAEGVPSSSSGFVALNMIQSASKEGNKYEKSTA